MITLDAKIRLALSVVMLGSFVLLSWLYAPFGLTLYSP